MSVVYLVFNPGTLNHGQTRDPNQRGADEDAPHKTWDAAASSGYAEPSACSASPAKKTVGNGMVSVQKLYSLERVVHDIQSLVMHQEIDALKGL